MKSLYIIGGTMGVGKTATSQVLKKKLPNSVFLDGDWCWDADPFQVTEETKQMVQSNICFMLNNFIHCSANENVIFCWVMHQQEIIDDILKELDISNCNVKVISLIASEEALRKRIGEDVKKGIRTEDAIERSVQRIELYKKLSTIKIDTSNISTEEAADMIAKL